MPILTKINESDYIPNGFSYVWSHQPLSDLIRFVFAGYFRIPLGKFRRLVLKFYVMWGRLDPWYEIRIIPGWHTWDIRKVGW